MRYFGGKFRIAKQVSDIINNTPYAKYWEPFCGACWVSQHVRKEIRLISDVNPYLISLWKALQKGWNPPEYVSEDEYVGIKNNRDSYPMELVGFVGFGLSFGGKWFGGYCRDGNGRNYAKNACNSLLNKMKNLRDAHFRLIDFNTSNYDFEGVIIYCDPPYQDTTGYSAVEEFNHDIFWEKCRVYAQKNTVLVSEYRCPSDFVEIARFPTRTDMRNKEGKMDGRIEKIFIHRGK